MLFKGPFRESHISSGFLGETNLSSRSHARSFLLPSCSTRSIAANHLSGKEDIPMISPHSRHIQHEDVRLSNRKVAGKAILNLSMWFRFKHFAQTSCYRSCRPTMQFSHRQRNSPIPFATDWAERKARPPKREG